MGPCEAFYAGPIQHPLLLWLAAVAGLAWSATREGLDPSLRRYCALLFALSVADAWLTSTHVYGIGALPGRAASLVPLFFVLAGDYRFLLLFGAATPEGALRPDGRALVTTALLTVIVPIASQLVTSLLPFGAGEPRVLFLVYELMFALLTLVLLRRHPRARTAPWIRPLGRFVLLYYGLWAAADVIILATGSDLGFALRVVPNLLYYGGLIGAIGQVARPGRVRTG